MPRRPRASPPPRVFLLSPARLDGARARMLFHPVTMFPVARALRSVEGAPIGDVFSFLSGLYFRGKLAYAEAFARPPRKLKKGVLVITANRGLVPASTRVNLDDLARFANRTFIIRRRRSAHPWNATPKRLRGRLARAASPYCWAASLLPKYVDVLLLIFGDQLLFPAEFVGRGDMSRGGLMLRCVDGKVELTYTPVLNAVRHGARPPKLPPR